MNLAKRLFPVFLFMVIISFSLFLGYGMYASVFRYFWRLPDEVAVPNILNQQSDQAKDILGKMGLGYRVTEKRYQEKGMPNAVISQFPPPNSRVRRGREIEGVVSLGPEQHEVPNLKGKSLNDTKLMLANEKLAIGKITVKPVKDLDVEQVLDQDPPPGALVKTGATVALTISQGAAPSVKVPSWVGKPVKDARKEIDSLNLSTGLVRWSWSDTYARGLIISHSPGGNSMVAPGTAVELDISAGSASGRAPIIRQKPITFIVPEGSDPILVQVKVQDDTGEMTVYEAEHAPGDHVTVVVTATGDAQVVVQTNNGQVLLRDTL